MSLADILINPPDPIFYTATILAYILSIVLSLYVCGVFKKCSEVMVYYYSLIFALIGYLLLIAGTMSEVILSILVFSLSYILLWLSYTRYTSSININGSSININGNLKRVLRQFLC